MRKFKLFLSIFIGTVNLVLVAVPVRAQVSNSISGGTSSDYQPPTNNPQSGVASGFQKTTTGLQPVPGQSNFAQENLTGSRDLQVAGSNGKLNPNTTTIAANKETKGINVIPFVVIGALTLVAIVYVAMQPSNEARKSKAAKAGSEPKAVIKPEPLPNTQKSTKKKSNKKTSAKKRKK